MNISVILCTFNRYSHLDIALNSIAASDVPENVEWEILVVDNNSTDRTREVVYNLMNRFPERIRYFFEPHPGKSYALNTGIRQAAGEILVFTDDDVIVEPAWL